LDIAYTHSFNVIVDCYTVGADTLLVNQWQVVYTDNAGTEAFVIPSSNAKQIKVSTSR
jgi:hypothetical protein